MILVTEQHLVLTPEKVVVSLRYAHVGTRIGAFLLDVVLAIIAVTIISTILGLASLLLGTTIPMQIAMFLASFAMFIYFPICEILMRGQTLGMKVAGLRVVMDDGTPETPSAAIYRGLLIIADIMPGFGLVGLIAMFTNSKSQRLGDLAAGTIVVHEPRPKFSFRPAPHRYGIHPWEHTVGELHRMNLEEYHAIKRLCDRFPELTPSVQVKSIAEIWDPFAGKHNIQPVANVHPIYQMEAVIMKYGRMHNLV